MRIRPSQMAASIAVLVMSLSLAKGALARDIDAVSFRDGTSGVIGGGYTTSAGERRGFVSVTNDGGRTWSATPIPYARMRAVAATPDGAFAGSDYFDWLYRYTDASGAWRATSQAPVAGSLSIHSIARLSSGRVVAVGMREPGSSKYAYITSSIDNGTTWTRDVEGPKYPPKDPYSDPPSTNAALVGVDEAPDGTLALAIGNEWAQGASSWVYSRRLAYRSTDGGSTWTTLTVPTDPNQRPISAVAVATSQTAFAFGQARQYIRTVDGGANWTLHSLPVPSPLVAVDILGADARGRRIVAVGTNGMTVRSLDGGQTWQYTRVWGAGTLRSVAMLTDDEWIAVGANEVIVRTTDAGASWQGTLIAEPPTAHVTAPASGFALIPLPVTIAGTASDVGVGVVGVEYRIRRGDGKFFAGAGWTAAETWLPAEWSAATGTWSATWTPDAETLALGLMVGITARATDGLGSTGLSGQVFSSTPPDSTPSVVVAGGESAVNTLTVPVIVSAPHAAHLRWRIDEEPYGAWRPVTSEVTVTLSPGDGVRRLHFQFSSNGTDPGAEASASIMLDTVPPSVLGSVPSATVGPAMLSVEATDALSGVAAIEVELDGVAQLEIASAVASVQILGPGQHTVRFRARDRAGNRSVWEERSLVVREPTALTLTAPSVSAYGSAALSGRLYDANGLTVRGAQVIIERSYDGRTFSRVATVTTSASDRSGWLFKTIVAPTRTTYFRARFVAAGSLAGSLSPTRRVVPRAHLSTPSFGRTALSSRLTYQVSGYLKPRHASGTYPVRIIAERKVFGIWRTERTLSARVSDHFSYSRYTAKVRLGRAGAWRLRAYHPADAQNAATYSAWRYVAVSP